LDLKPAVMETTASEFPSVQLTLRDGRSATIREVRPEDANAFRAALLRFSADTLHSRFFSAVRPTEAMVERGVHSHAQGERALVAVVEEGGAATIVGGGRCISGADKESGEFAVTIADEWRGLGLASGIMRALIRDARARGLKRMEGFVLKENSSMLGLARRLGFEIGASEEGPSVKLARLDLVRDHDGGN
jgi:RimJ/RimL family protein N-acetyltransferase